MISSCEYQRKSLTREFLFGDNIWKAAHAVIFERRDRIVDSLPPSSLAYPILYHCLMRDIVMRLLGKFPLFGLLWGAALADMVKDGNTCTVTPKSALKKRQWSQDAHSGRSLPEVVDIHFEPQGRYPRSDPALGIPEKRAPQFPGFGGGGGGGAQQPSADDDTPAILQAFKECGQDGHIILEEGNYMIRQIMDTSNLRNVWIDIYGRLEWSGDNIQYWLSNSISVTYAGRSTAWRMGGTNITMLGHGKALFFGNGQIWYDQNRNQGNQNGRPISLTLWNANDVWIDGITWRQSQFWNTFIAHSSNVTMTNIDMNSTSATQWSTVNTDGTNTWNSKDVFLRNWVVTAGDVRIHGQCPFVAY